MKGRMTALVTVSVGIIIGAAQSAIAQSNDAPRKGLYLALGAGVASVRDPSLEYREPRGTFGGTGTYDSLVTKAELKSSIDLGGSLGYDFGMVRTDMEINYSRHRVTALQVQSLNGAAVSSVGAASAQAFCAYEEIAGCSVSGNRLSFTDGGKVRQLSALANLWIDIPAGRTVTPYVGAGAGVAGFELNGEGKTRFAYQLGAGIAINVSSSIAFTADYRHRWINSATIDDSGSSLVVGKLQTNRLSGGVRFTL